MISQRGLEAFQAVMRLGSVSSAAKSLSISQPAVSRSLQMLEQEIDVVLFTRAGNRIIPTDAARLLSEKVELSFVGLQDIAETARQIREGVHGAVALAAMPVLATTILPAAVANLSKRTPYTEISLHATETNTIIPLVSRRKAALGFISPRRAIPEVQTLCFDQFSYRCVMQPQNPLAEHSVVDMQDLSGMDLIGFVSATTTSGRALDQAFSKMTNPPRIAIRAHLAETVTALVRKTGSIAIVDPFSAYEFEQHGGVSRPIELKETFGVSVIAPVGVGISGIAEKLVWEYRRLASGLYDGFR